MVFKNQADMPKCCPPSDAGAEDLEPVYRYTKKEVVQENDFENHIEANIPFKEENKCGAIALSFFTTTEAAKSLRRHKKFRKMVISQGKITAKCGIHNIENKHINLWVFEGVNMLPAFLGEGD
ncbi:hypothetical protein [Aquibacillus rhizosphaerae]|uniref:Uncharacterized protein n=1 Tax=Aquibacillus rhizosphaerae TaxID=3051431 RepID=A0ABT7L9D7_9BACI|nr:hypothetical protein [Aquibacillus sp. LR5S19]MDL4842476.1 hypothetical protein [Aquibacillus sp. LR5S19]